MHRKQVFASTGRRTRRTFDMLETTASPHFYGGFLKDRMAEEDRRLQYDDHKYCDTGLCGGFIEAFERLTSEELEETELYIQNVYATLFSFQNNSRVNLNMLRTALINTRKLNKALQDMLHNMDKFFERLLDQESLRRTFCGSIWTGMWKKLSRKSIIS